MVLQVVARPAYLSCFLFSGLPPVAECCVRRGLKMVSKPAVPRIFFSTIVATRLTPEAGSLRRLRVDAALR